MKERGITQTALAELMGVPQSTVQKWKAGSVPGGALLALATRVLKLNGHWVLTGKGQVEAPGTTPDLERLRAQAKAEAALEFAAAFREATTGRRPGDPTLDDELDEFAQETAAERKRQTRTGAKAQKGKRRRA